MVGEDEILSETKKDKNTGFVISTLSSGSHLWKAFHPASKCLLEESLHAEMRESTTRAIGEPQI